MQGALCHDSGQSVHSVLKSMNGLNKETLLDIDGRIVHTLLLLKPGFVSTQYSAGRLAPLDVDAVAALVLLAPFGERTPRTSTTAKQRLISGVFSALPPITFVWIPLFAILLILFHELLRRLYMERLIVALHSRAFIFLSLLLITASGMASTWLPPHPAASVTRPDGVRH